MSSELGKTILALKAWFERDARPRLAHAAAMLDQRIRATAAWATPRLLAAAGALVRLVTGPVWALVRLTLQTLAALVVLFLEWGWRPLLAAISRLSRFVTVQRIEAWIANLPPYGALAVIGAPAVLLFPLKLLALYLFATGHAMLGVALIAAAKIVGTAIVARLFVLTQPKLMQIEWFARAYGWLMPWKERMFAIIRQSAAWRYGRIARVAAKQALKHVAQRMRPLLAEARSALAPILTAARTALTRLTSGGRHL